MARMTEALRQCPSVLIRNAAEPQPMRMEDGGLRTERGSRRGFEAASPFLVRREKPLKRLLLGPLVCTGLKPGTNERLVCTGLKPGANERLVCNLGSGLTLFVPSWRDLELDGACLEGRGLAPDIEVEADLGAFRNGQDPVLASALAFLRGGTVERGAKGRPGCIPPSA